MNVTTLVFSYLLVDIEIHYWMHFFMYMECSDFIMLKEQKTRPIIWGVRIIKSELLIVFEFYNPNK